MTRSDRTTSTSAGLRMPVLAAGVIALAVVAGLLLAFLLTREPMTGAADPTFSATPIPSAPASPSQAPSEGPSEEPAPSEAPSAPAEPAEEPESPYRDPVVANLDDVLPPGGVARVTADALRVREQALVDSPERMVLGRGDLVVVGPTYQFEAFGPAEADGYTWYPVAVLSVDELPKPGGAVLEVADRGWVAIGDGATAWLELLDPRCTDDEPTLQHLSSLTEWERLACYGDEQLTFEGILGCGGCGGMIPGTFTPEWLASPMNYDYISVEPREAIGPLSLHWSPDGPERPNTSGVAPILRVTGHFDDPAAAECSHTWTENSFGIEAGSEGDPRIVQLFCRSNFVVDSYEVIGEDEDFPFS